MNSLCRQVFFINASSILAAQDELATIDGYRTDAFTCIDLTADFNQNKWLGRELENTLIYFDSASRLNGLLAVLGCIKAPYVLALSCDEALLVDFFKANKLLPAIKELSMSMGDIDLMSVSSSIEQVSENTLKAEERLRDCVKGAHLIGVRGAGKSSLLGRFAAGCHKQGLSVALCSPGLASSRNTYRAFKKKLPDVSREMLLFCEFSSVVRDSAHCDVVVVDEASCCPRGIVEQLMRQCDANGQKLILSTTIEGYEGTGQSYRLNYLDVGSAKQTLKYERVELMQPLRFSHEDPIHRLCREIVSPEEEQFTGVDGLFCVTHKELREHGWTSACFTLLQESHYRTTPNDLADFYSQPSLFVVAFERGRMVAALRAFTESMPRDIPYHDVVYGVRRVKDAMTHQALIHAYGSPDEGLSLLHNSDIVRISRIAVSKEYRRRGIASSLVLELISFIRKASVRFVSASFGVTSSKLAFWTSLGFSPIRLGLHPNKANNECSLMMMRTTTDGSCETYCVDHYHRLFAQHVEFFQLNKGLFSEIQIDYTVSQSVAMDLEEQFESVLGYHRDINWLLPILDASLVQRGLVLDSDTAVLFSGGLRLKSEKSMDHVLLKKLRSLLTLEGKS